MLRIQLVLVLLYVLHPCIVSNVLVRIASFVFLSFTCFAWLKIPGWLQHSSYLYCTVSHSYCTCIAQEHETGLKDAYRRVSTFIVFSHYGNHSPLLKSCLGHVLRMSVPLLSLVLRASASVCLLLPILFYLSNE